MSGNMKLPSSEMKMNSSSAASPESAILSEGDSSALALAIPEENEMVEASEEIVLGQDSENVSTEHAAPHANTQQIGMTESSSVVEA